MRARTLAVTAVVTLAIALTGCTNGGSGSGSDGAGSADGTGVTLADVTEKGELVIATEGTYSPFSFHADGGSGELTGYDVDVITAVAEKLGVDAKFEETQFDGIFAGLDAGRFDLIANQISINDEREKKYLFSEPYTISPGVLIVKDGSDIADFSDLEGKTTAQSLTSNWYEVAEGYGANVEAVEGWAQSVELLKQGRVDATINDNLTFLSFEKENGDQGLDIVAEEDEPSRNAFLLRKGSDDLVDAIDEALDELRADGTLAEISDKYFGSDVSQ